MNKVLCIDIGGTSIKYGYVDMHGNISESGKISLPSTYEVLLEEVKKLYNPNFEKCVCVSSPCNYYDGKLNGDSFAKYLINKDLKGDLEAKVGVQIRLQNDGNCAALGEKFINKKLSNLVTVVIGSGIGGGIICNSKLLKGHSFIAGDFGYQILNEQKIRDDIYVNNMGTKGGLNYLITEAMKINPKYNSAEIIYELADNEIKSLMDENIRYIAIGIINLHYIINPEVFIIGGNISKNEKFISAIRAKINKIISTNDNYTTAPTIIQSKLNNDANLVGAASMYWLVDETNLCIKYC